MKNSCTKTTLIVQLKVAKDSNLNLSEGFLGFFSLHSFSGIVPNLKHNLLTAKLLSAIQKFDSKMGQNLKHAGVKFPSSLTAWRESAGLPAFLPCPSSPTNPTQQPSS